MNDTDLIFYLSLGAFIAIFVYYLTVWYVFGKDDKLKPIVPTFKMPKGLSLGQAEILKNDGMYFSRSKAFEMSMASLISKGFIDIESYDTQEIFFKKGEKDPSLIEFEEEAEIYNGFFEYDDRIRVKKETPESQSDVSFEFVRGYKMYL